LWTGQHAVARATSAGGSYTDNGNVLLDHLHGASVERRAGGSDMQAEMEAVAARLTGEGLRPYVIPGGDSDPLGALGYVNAALELVNQSAERGLRIDHLVHATGSAGTQAGLVVGLHGLNSKIRLLGVGVRAPREKQESMMHALGQRTWELQGLPGELPRETVAANCDYVGDGYAARASTEQQTLFNKLSVDVRKAILEDQRETLSIVELNELIEHKAKGGRTDKRASSFVACPRCGSVEIEKHAIEWTVHDPEAPRKEPGHVAICKMCGWVEADSLKHETTSQRTGNEVQPAIQPDLPSAGRLIATLSGTNLEVRRAAVSLVPSPTRSP